MDMVGLETRKAIETDDPNFSRQLEHRIIYADGETGYITVRFFIVKNEKGETVKTYGVNQDITERKRAENELKKVAGLMKLAKEKAEASDKLKTTFLNNISHELRTPLNGILGFAEIMSQTDISEEERRVSLSMLFESSDRLLNTITNYMDISLINSGNMSLHKKDFLPEKILRELYASEVVKCSARNLELFLEIPERTEKLAIFSDPEILRKILTHLLRNAIKFTEKGSIKFGYTVHKTELEFFVKDTGIGIGKESLKSVFKHFVKEDRGPLKISEGSGLGLSISKGLAEHLGGKIRVESEKGIGSSFFFTVPVEKEIEYNISLQVGKEQKENKKTSSILVAEDDLVNFFYLKTLLRQNTSAEIIHASNGKEAVDKFRENPDIDIILMDIKMPVMDGLEATRHIKAINRDVPVIAITAYAMAGDEARIMDAGCDYYLIKPINKKLLLERMAEYIEL
jgi:signal transduction histidine kinase